MDPNLQQALVATRAGQLKEAQIILSQHLIQQPDDPDAWYLLSQLVGSDEREELYLYKTVELEPQHNHAASRLTTLGVSAAAIKAAADSGTKTGEPFFDLTETAEIEEDIPAWLMEENEDNNAEIAAFAASAVVASEAELPDWLRDLEETDADAGDDVIVETRTSAEVSIPDAESVPTPVDTSKKSNTGDAWLTGILILLVIIASIVLGYLLYLVFWV